MKILFLDQSGKLGGAELSLADVVAPYRTNCLVGLFADGAFRELLEQRQIPVQVLTHQVISVQKTGSLLQGLNSLQAILPLVQTVAQLASNYDVIYANTQKALVIGALASLLTRRPLIYHLRDILSAEHFSFTNRKIAVTLANQCAAQVITNSQATQTAFVQAGGRVDRTTVIYNGFHPELYQIPQPQIHAMRRQLGWEGKFIVGHFSRLSPWKGQHILIDALAHCSEDIVAILVGDALFGEQEYVEQLQQQVTQRGLKDRIQFLGFRSDIPVLMAACDVIAHTSTAPEPFGRVIVEGMLSGRPVIAAAAGGAIELIKPDRTGWLCPPGDSQKLAEIMMSCCHHPNQAASIAQQAQQEAMHKFHVTTMNQQIAQLLEQVITTKRLTKPTTKTSRS